MKTIYVERSFLFRPDKGDPVPFAVGSHTVEDDVADHWFVKANCAERPVDTTASDLQAKLDKANALIQLQGETIAGQAQALADLQAKLDEANKDASADKQPSAGETNQPWAKGKKGA